MHWITSLNSFLVLVVIKDIMVIEAMSITAIIKIKNHVHFWNFTLSLC